jgi:hypothetical protein
MVVPPGRQIQCATFDLENKNVSRRRNLPDWMQELAGAIRWTIWTTAESGMGPRAEVRVRVRAKVLGTAAWAGTALLVILKFFVPGHLNRFELSFVR